MLFENQAPLRHLTGGGTQTVITLGNYAGAPWRGTPYAGKQYQNAPGLSVLMYLDEKMNVALLTSLRL